MAVVDTNNNAIARITEVQGIATTAISSANAFITQLQGMADLEPPYITPGVATYNPPVPTIDAAAPARPSEVDTILEDAQNAEPNMPSVNTDFSVDINVDDLNDIQVPNQGDLAFNEVEYYSDLLDATKTKLLNDVVNGGTGLAASVEADIYNRDLDRREEARQTEIDNVIGEFAGRGFTLPQGVLAAAVDAINEKHRMDSNQRSAEIRIKQAELAQNNTQFAITSAIQLESVLINHHDNVMNRALQAARAVLDVAVAIINARVALAEGKVRLQDARLTLLTNLERIKLETYSAEVAAYSKKVDSVMARARAYVDLYQADTQVYSANINKGEALARMQIQQSQISIENVRASIQMALEASKTNLEAFINTAKVRIGAIEGAAQVYAGEVTAALNSLSTIIQLASSGITTKTE